jgi:hypothetical protein
VARSREQPSKRLGARPSLASTAGALACVAVSAACNVEPTARDGCAAELGRAPGCPAAALVVMSDFISTQVSLHRLDGATICGSLVSSARSETTPIAFALSGDVVLPSNPPSSGRVVLLDRYGTNVVSFLDGSSGAFTAQLAVGTGFEANIQDYLEIDDTLALVSRWGENPVPGQEAFDAGGDLLVIDTRAAAIVARIELPRDDAWPPRPAALTRLGEHAVVTLQRFALDIKSQGDGVLVGVGLESRSVEWSLALAGLKNCGAFTPSPDGALAAVACTGFVDRNGEGARLAESGLVLFELGTVPPLEVARFPASDLLGEPIQAELEFFGDRRLLLKTQTPLGARGNNRVLALDLDRGAEQAQVVLEARPGDDGSGLGVVFGGMLCTPGCAERCLVADAARGVVARFAIEEAGLVELPSLAVSGSVGLPPRDVGAF